MDKNNKDIKILIIEDEILLAELVKKKLTAEGFTAITADDGQVGLNMALAEKPDLILLDLVMPNMDGLEMLKKLRKDSWGHDVNVIILSNLNDISKISEVMTEGGITDYLIKTNWQLEEIIEKIKEKLRLK